MKASTVPKLTGYVAIGVEQQDDLVVLNVRACELLNVVIFDYDAVSASALATLRNPINGFTNVIAQGLDYSQRESETVEHYVLLSTLQEAVWSVAGSLMCIGDSNHNIQHCDNVKPEMIAGMLIKRADKIQEIH